MVGSLPPEEQQLWFPNQTAHDPDSWDAPSFINLKTGYDILVNNHDCKVQEMLLPPLKILYKTHVRNHSILPFEMHTLESGETPSRTLKWSPLGFLSHIKRRTIGDRFPLSLWEVWFCSTLGVPIPPLIGPSHLCACNSFDYDVCGDHL